MIAAGEETAAGCIGVAWLRNPLVSLAVALFAAGCGSDRTAYERSVAKEEPVYCYQTLAGIDCYKRPDFRDERMMVNFYGPPPADFERPEPPEAAELTAPPPVDHYCRVGEPDACALPPPVADAETPAPALGPPVPRPAPEPPLAEATDAPAAAAPQGPSEAAVPEAPPSKPPAGVIDPPQET